MASGDIVASVRPVEFVPDGGPVTFNPLRPVGALTGIPLGKENGFSFLFQVPANGSPLSTGLTATVAIVDDPTSLAPGKVIELGVTIEPFTTSTVDTDPATTYEVLASCTINATANEPTLTAVAVTNANLSSLAAGNWALCHVRRVGTNAADTHTGRPYCIGVQIKDT